MDAAVVQVSMSVSSAQDSIVICFKVVKNGYKFMVLAVDSKEGIYLMVNCQSSPAPLTYDWLFFSALEIAFTITNLTSILSGRGNRDNLEPRIRKGKGRRTTRKESDDGLNLHLGTGSLARRLFPSFLLPSCNRRPPCN